MCTLTFCWESWTRELKSFQMMCWTVYIRSCFRLKCSNCTIMKIMTMKNNKLWSQSRRNYPMQSINQNNASVRIVGPMGLVESTMLMLSWSEVSSRSKNDTTSPNVLKRRAKRQFNNSTLLLHCRRWFTGNSWRKTTGTIININNFGISWTRGKKRRDGNRDSSTALQVSNASATSSSSFRLENGDRF